MTDDFFVHFAIDAPDAETILKIAEHYENLSELAPAFGYYLIAFSLQDTTNPTLASKLGAIAFKLGDESFSLKCFRLAIQGQTDPVEREKSARAITNLFLETGFNVQSARPAPFNLNLPPLLQTVAGTWRLDRRTCLTITGATDLKENGLQSITDSRDYRGMVFQFAAMALIAPAFNADLFLLYLVRDLKPSLILFRHAQLTYRASDPRVETLIAIREQTRIPVLGLYCDIAKPGFQRICRAYMTGLDGMITWDRPFPDTLTRPPATVFRDLWTPLPGELFRPSEQPRTVDIGFVGRADAHYVERRAYLDGLTAAKIHVATHGPSFDDVLTQEEMVAFLRSCKIVLNFSSTAVISPWEIPASTSEVHHVKGRVFEAIACGALLFESRNAFTPRFFTPGDQFVEFTDLADLKTKLAFYLTHDTERERIARAGQAHYLANFTSAHYWRNLEEMVDEIKMVREAR